jgi:purine-nucleoside phosphorylase
MTGAKIYSARLAELAHQVGKSLDMRLYDGTYLCSLGPTYETFAEVNAGRALGMTVSLPLRHCRCAVLWIDQDLIAKGVSAFGMSTVHETLTAASLGCEVFAMSLCTNLAAGLEQGVILTHEDVKEVAQEAAPRFMKFMRTFLEALTVPEASHPCALATADAIATVPLPQVCHKLADQVPTRLIGLARARLID